MGQERFEKEVTSRCSRAKVMFVCGGDLLESFTATDAKTGEPVWSAEHKEIILKTGLVCMEREGTDLDKVIESDSLIKKYKENIVRFSPRVQNNVSSTLVRELLQLGKSLKYLVPEDARLYLLKEDLKRLAPWGGDGQPASKKARSNGES